MSNLILHYTPAFKRNGILFFISVVIPYFSYLEPTGRAIMKLYSSRPLGHICAGTSWACSKQRAHKMKQCKWIIFAGHISPAYAGCKTLCKKCWCNTCCCAQTQCYPLHVKIKYIQGGTDLPKSSAEACIEMDPSCTWKLQKNQHCLRLSHSGLFFSVRMRTGSWKPFVIRKFQRNSLK